MSSNPEQDAARLLREVWWDSPDRDGLPVDPARIARRLNVRVYTMAMDSAASGALSIKPGRDPEIYLNEDDSPNRQRFTCAHELGHYRKRAMEGTDSFEVVDRRDVLSSQGTYVDEIYANQFAAALLMPADLVRSMWRRERDPVILAYRFGVSVDAMTYRIKNLRLS